MAKARQPDWLPDWRNADKYPMPKEISLEQWTWQFLRRNRKYRNGWQELSKISPIEITKIAGSTYFEHSGGWREFAASWGIKGLPPDPSENQPKRLFFDSSLLVSISQFGESVQGSLFDSVRDKRLGLEKRIDNLKERFGKNAVIPASLMRLGKVKEV